MTAGDEARVAPIDTISQQRFDELAGRAQAIQDLVTMPDRRSVDIDFAAEVAGVHRATIYRDLRRVSGAGEVTVRALAQHKRGFPKGRSRLHPRVETIILQRLLHYYLTPAKPSMLDTVGKIAADCEAEGLAPPARAAVIRRLHKLKRAKVEARRYGRKAAEAATPRHGRFLVTEPWAVFEIDHTLADVIIVDSEHRKPIGRAWLTLVFDVATRMIVGYYVSLEPPSLLRAAIAISFAVADKGPWLSARGYGYPWPARGLPRLVHSDRAAEFRADVFVRGLKNQGVETFLRPAGRPHWGGHIERMIGTMMGACRMLPGATHSSPSARGDYDSVGSARLTLAELDDWFAKQILGVYHNTVHSALGKTPLQAWEEATAGRTPRMPDDPEAFRLDMLPSSVRQITRHGIRLFGQDYACEELKLAYAERKGKVEVKFDPRDLSKVWVRLEHGRYVIAPYRFAHEPGRAPTLALYRAMARATRGERGPAQGLLARRAMAEIEAELAASAKTSQRARRMQERLADARRATQPPAETNDSWGGAF